LEGGRSAILQEKEDTVFPIQSACSLTFTMADGNAADFSQSDLPPGLTEMFINSTDTLRQREINQSIPHTWNDRPPLFYTGLPKRRTFLWRKDPQFPQAEGDNEAEQEDPNLLKGVSNSKQLRNTVVYIVYCITILFPSHYDSI
jgi:hypothetical protein